MPFLTSIIDLDSIYISKSDDFRKPSAVQIEALANTVIKLEGSISIPIVYQVSLDEYELISGHIGYLAYQKAYEIKPSLPERLSVFVVDSKNRPVIDQQLKILNSLPPTQAENPDEKNSENSQTDLHFSNLASLIRHNHQELSSGLQELYRRFQDQGKRI
jgi:hypothetical protein